MVTARFSLLLALIAASACTTSSSAQQTRTARERKVAPNFSLNDVNGRRVRLSDFRGKVVLLNFWATNCGPCKVEIPWFIEFEQKYRDRGLAIIGVAMDEEGWSIVRPYLTERRVNYRIVIGTEKLAGAYGGVEALPTTFLIDKQGRIAETHVGLISKQTYEDQITAML
jgi:cytochrome c biogenesis protein CcmG/thiol:disulfide interchange protein DsbE